MKTIMKHFISTVLLITTVLVSLTACGPLFSYDSNDDYNNNTTTAKPKETKTITMYVDDIPYTYTATVGELASVEVFRKPNYYFVGAYDSKEGGTKYFDLNGESTMVWSKGNPNTFYARFKSIYDLSYSQMQYEESPYLSSPNDRAKYISFEFSDELKQAIAGNMDKDLTITLSLDLSNNGGWKFGKVGLTNLTSGGELKILGEKLPIEKNEYTNYTYTTTMPAKLFKQGLLYVYFYNGLILIPGDAMHYAKNISVSVSFAESEMPAAE